MYAHVYMGVFDVYITMRFHQRTAASFTLPYVLACSAFRGRGSTTIGPRRRHKQVFSQRMRRGLGTWTSG